jgi:hypothetical protein
MVDVRGYFQSKSTYLNASHVADGELDLTIGNVQLEIMPRDGEEKWVIYFWDHTLGLPLNKTNGDTLIMAFGPENTDWIGGKVTLVKVPTKFDGEAREGVRIKVDPKNYLAQEKRTPPKPAPPRKAPEIPF